MSLMITLCGAQFPVKTFGYDEGVSEFVFVYGTLKPGLHNYYVAQKAGLLSYTEGYIEGFDLYDLQPENYPAIKPGRGQVQGGVMRFENIAAALELLDELEEAEAEPPMYTRRLVDVEPLGLKAWVYVYNLSVKRLGASLQPSGLWLPLTGLEPDTKRF